jgi:hypothetical protein
LTKPASLLINRSITKIITILLLSIGSAFAGSLTVVAVGDIMMGSDYPGNNLPPDNGKDLFKAVSSALMDADLTLGNLEGTLLSGGVCAKKIEKGRCYAFRTPPGWALNLLDVGFDFLNLANNHMNDFGAGGIKATQDALEQAGLMYGGAFRKTGHFDINGNKVVIVSFSTSPNTNSVFEIPNAQRIVAELAEENDIVIVSCHAGGEGVKYLHICDDFEYYMGWPRGNVVKFARAVIDSGADLFWGHGPHVPRAMEIYKDRLIAYSLGNFFTWGFNLGDERGYAPILKARLDSHGVFLGGEIISALQRTYQYLKIDSLNRAAKLIQKLSLDDFPDSAPLISDQGVIYPAIKIQY